MNQTKQHQRAAQALTDIVTELTLLHATRPKTTPDSFCADIYACCKASPDCVSYGHKPCYIQYGRGEKG